MAGEEEAVAAVGEGEEAAFKENSEQDGEHSEAQLPAAERGPSPKELLTEMTRCFLHHAMLWPWVYGMPPAHLAAAVVVLVRHHFKLGGAMKANLLDYRAARPAVEREVRKAADGAGAASRA
ncbi:hypothetical protein GPECTOR_1g138 [Gonium pectorale]|uniref:Uncharacterized protein n=1 Tax=Gonium pectorale TaxID=33097 RepID=A0A150H230_GONPE|nr:hypothetical protein GPECTOR_1g138 [Gonium pectorale]|eukprot:KXZ56161.1 hypothetical protein GPECTOR_1g138 [Gonium pectorale]